jgi:2,5-dihydroxypyridine 5,6-dioxygenase
MLQERIEGKWIDSFAGVFRLCAVKPGEDVAILSETQSRPVTVQLAELALAALGARPFHVIVPTPPQRAPVPVRSTGASDAIGGQRPVVAALAQAGLVVDCTVEGLLHAAELPEILRGGARVLMISNEHPEALERLAPAPDLEPRVKAAGTDLEVDLDKAVAGGGWGYTARPGTITHWPGGLCLCFPARGTVRGRLVLAPGDVNLTFKRYLESAITLTVEDDHVVDIAGGGLDAELMRSYFAAWGDREAYAVSHVGWGMNRAARWDAMTMYDRDAFNGTELRAFAGNFLYSTGANEVAGRRTLGHFDLPMRSCTIALDGEVVVAGGVLQGELA